MGISGNHASVGRPIFWKYYYSSQLVIVKQCNILLVFKCGTGMVTAAYDHLVTCGDCNICNIGLVLVVTNCCNTHRTLSTGEDLENYETLDLVGWHLSFNWAKRSSLPSAPMQIFLHHHANLAEHISAKLRLPRLFS